MHQACYDTAHYLADRIAALGSPSPFDMLYNGRGGIPALAFSLKPGGHPGYNLYGLSDRLRTRGWLVPAYSMPTQREDLVVMRILVRHGFSRDMGELLLEDLSRAMEHCAALPAEPAVPCLQKTLSGI